MALAAAGRCPHGLSLVSPRALGQESWGWRQDQAPVWHSAGWGRDPTQPLGGLLTRWWGGTHGHQVAGSGGGLCPRSRQSRTGSRWGAQLCRGHPPQAYLSPDCQIQQSLAYPENSWVFWLTQFHQTTQWITDSEQQQKKVSQVKFFIYDSEGTSKFRRATGSLSLDRQSSWTGPMEKLRETGLCSGPDGVLDVCLVPESLV